MRILVALHRYLGIALGWLIVAWCLSGAVMIYVPYPAVSKEDHVAALPLLDFESCCRIGPQPEWLEGAPAGRFTIESEGGRPVLVLDGAPGDRLRLPLDGDAPTVGIDAAGAVRIAAERTAHWQPPTGIEHLGEIDFDQWTVGYYRPGQRLHHLALGDPRGTEWYLHADDASLIQATTARERFWNQLGSVLHWLYYTPLRARGQLWSEIVIWATIAALALTLFGVALGLLRIRFGRGARLSPYRGLARWHHVLGLTFGVVTLTWLLSGLLSMNPWGALAGTGPRGETARIEDFSLPVSALRPLVAGWSGRALPPDTTHLEAAPFAGRLYLLAYDGTGRAQRLDGRRLDNVTLTAAELEAAARRLLPDVPVVEAELIDAPDAYYYDHKTAGRWPVFRVVLDDADRTRYYLDPESGRILDRIDASRRAYRWLFTALHSLDFAAVIRIRPVWDMLMLVLLAGVATVGGSGVWMGYRYLARRS